MQPAQFQAQRLQGGGIGCEYSVDYSLDVAVKDRQRRAHLVCHIAQQAGAALFRRSQTPGQGVDVLGQRRHFRDRWQRHLCCIVPIGDATSDTAQCVDGSEDA